MGKNASEITLMLPNDNWSHMLEIGEKYELSVNNLWFCYIFFYEMD